jgi:hypothetical protein
MTIDPELLELMPTLVDIYPWTGEDTVGNNTYGTAVRRNSRLENLTKDMAVTTAQGDTVIATMGDSVQVIIDYCEPIIEAGSKVVVVASTRTMRVVSQTIEYDENGPYYQSLQCQNNQET